MAKLTHYKNFQSLKSDVQPKKEASTASRESYADFEEFIKLVKQRVAVKKNV